MGTSPNRPLDKKSFTSSGRIVGLGRFLGLKPQAQFYCPFGTKTIAETYPGEIASTSNQTPVQLFDATSLLL
jgi:hypothetical protein